MNVRNLVFTLTMAAALTACVSAQTMGTPAPGQHSGYITGGNPYMFDFAWPGQNSAHAAQLAQEYVKSEKPEAKEEIRKKLNDLLSKQFDENANQQQKTLEDLQRQITHLQATLKKRSEHKADIVNRRLEQLLLDADGMGWNAQPGSGFGTALHAPHTPTDPFGWASQPKPEKPAR